MITPDWELKELFFRSKSDPKFGVKLGLKVTPKNKTNFMLAFIKGALCVERGKRFKRNAAFASRKRPLCRLISCSVHFSYVFDYQHTVEATISFPHSLILGE